MKTLLFGGAYSVGKTTAIIRLTQKLINSGYRVIVGSIPPTNPAHRDIRLILEGSDNTGRIIKIYINSATDTYDTILDAKKFIDNYEPVDYFISSIRDHDFWPRRDFFSVMGINPTSNDLLEIPLAKITRKKGNFVIALNWYESTLDKLVDKIIKEQPFNFI